MSYDIGLYINTGNEEHEVHDCGNYTYNVSGMYYKVLDGGINSIDGMNASEAIPKLKEAYKAMQDKKQEL